MLAIAPAAVVGAATQASAAPPRHVVHHERSMVALPGLKFSHVVDRHDVDATPPDVQQTKTTIANGSASVLSYGEPRPGHAPATSRGPPAGIAI
jgi:hypothetical protein